MGWGDVSLGLFTKAAVYVIPPRISGMEMDGQTDYALLQFLTLLVDS